MNNLIKKHFTQVPNELINDSLISRDARFLFVYLCSKPEDWKFYTKTIEKELNCSKDSRIKYTKELMEKGWITVKQKVETKGKFGANEIYLNPYPNFSDTVKSPRPKISDADKNGDGKNPTHSNTNNNTNTNLFSNKEVVPVLSEEVLKYLNQKKPSKIPFKPSRSNLKDIEARIKEKFNLKDFKSVVDYKVAEWKDSKKMRQYIRPDTLFGSKFNGYLIQSNENEISKEDGSDNFKYNPQEEAEML